MANLKHLLIFKLGVAAWNMWRNENSGIEPDLGGTDLGPANLRNADLSNTNLSGASLVHAYLGNADLSEANLSNANLAHAYLDGANFCDANLNNADLRWTQMNEANLSNANLRGANLHGANLAYASLRDAILNDAHLVEARLCRTKLSGANLSGATIGDTTFGLINLSNCKGLESVKAQRPCTIDFQTLQASKHLPKSFLLKIGLPELYIDYLPDFYNDKGIRLYSVFLSHSWTNKDFARKLYEALLAKGVNVFFDEKELKPGDLIHKKISEAIVHHDKMILVCSKDSLNSWWVDMELDNILNKRFQYKEALNDIDELLIPITIDDYVYQWNGARADEVRRYFIGDFKDWKNEASFMKGLNDLIQALNVDRPKEIKPPPSLKGR